MTGPRKNCSFDECRAELESYKGLESGWDGYRGSPFDSGLVSQVQSVVNQIEALGLPLDDIIPGPCSDGSIDLEVDGKGGRILHLLFQPGEKIQATRVCDGVYTEFWVETNELQEHLDWVGGKVHVG